MKRLIFFICLVLLAYTASNARAGMECGFHQGAQVYTVLVPNESVCEQITASNLSDNLEYLNDEYDPIDRRFSIVGSGYHNTVCSQADVNPGVIYNANYPIRACFTNYQGLYYTYRAGVNYTDDDCECDTEQVCEYIAKTDSDTCWPQGATGSLAVGYEWSYQYLGFQQEGECHGYEYACTELEQDSDGDGIPDSEDECPNDPNDLCNQPTDTDGDGIFDEDDTCPNDFWNRCNEPGYQPESSSGDSPESNSNVPTQTDDPTDIDSTNESDGTVLSQQTLKELQESNDIARGQAMGIDDINKELNAQTGYLQDIASSTVGPCNPAQPGYYDCQLSRGNNPSHTANDAQDFGELFQNFYNDLNGTNLIQSFQGVANVIPSGGSCPTFSVDLSGTIIGQNVSTTVHCDLAESIRSVLATVMILAYSIIGFRIMVSA